MTTISLCSTLFAAKPMISSSLSFKRQRDTVFSVRARAANNLAAARNGATNFYKVLALTPDDAGPAEVRRAYRYMARQYHPDACHDPSKKEESTKMFLQLHEAYETLSDPVLRQEYDCKLSSGNCRPVLRRSSSGSRRRWQEQIVELKRRSKQGRGQEGSWGSRMRAQNAQKME